jgi:DNA polymerase phi
LELSEQTRFTCQQRFYNAIAVSFIDLEDKERAHENSSLFSILELVQSLESDPKLRLLHETDGSFKDFKRVLRSDLNEIQQYRLNSEPFLGLTRSDAPLMAKEELTRLAGLESLILYVGLLAYSEFKEIKLVFDDLHICLEKFFERSLMAKQGKAGCRQRKSGEPDLIEVIIDILLGFLARPSSSLRDVVEHVFRIFCSQLSENALRLLLEQLLVKKNPGDTDESDPVFSGEDDTETDGMNIETIEEDTIEAEEEQNGQGAPQTFSNDVIMELSPKNESEEDLNDEQMEMFDEQLSAMFRERKLAAFKQRG